MPVITTVNIHEAKTQMSKLARLVEEGQTVIVARAGVPIMEWRSVKPTKPLIGSMKGKFGPEDYDAAFTPEADAEIATMFDDEF